MNPRRVRDIDYQLLPGTNRKTTDIVIERNGVVTVRPPSGYTPEQVDAVVEAKRMWIYRNLAEWRDLNAVAVTRRWVNGETFLYLGRCYRLSIVDQERSLLLKNGRFCLKRSLIDGEGASAARKAFETYYTQQGLQRITDRAAYYAPKVGVKAAAVTVKDMSYRWATCSKNNTLAFHWKCMMAPPKIIDYIVVHELCHFYYKDHSQAFWNEVDKVMPDFEERKGWLKKNGANLDL